MTINGMNNVESYKEIETNLVFKLGYYVNHRSIFIYILGRILKFIIAWEYRGTAFFTYLQS